MRVSAVIPANWGASSASRTTSPLESFTSPPAPWKKRVTVCDCDCGSPGWGMDLLPLVTATCR